MREYQSIPINKIEMEDFIEELPVLYGTDTAQIFIDLDNNCNTGYSTTHYSIGADYLGVISGKNGKIFDNKLFKYNEYFTDHWQFMEKLNAANNQNELECQFTIPEYLSNPLNGKFDNTFNVYFYITDWNNENEDDFEVVRNSDNNLELKLQDPSIFYDFQKDGQEITEINRKILDDINQVNISPAEPVLDKTLSADIVDKKLTEKMKTRTAYSPFIEWSVSGWDSTGDVKDITTDDIDGDGLMEIILVEYRITGGGQGYVRVFEWNSVSNSFPTTPSWSSNNIGYPTQVTTGDSDGDNRKEIIVADWANEVEIYEYSGSGDISTLSTTPTKTIITGSGLDPYCVTMGDFDGDGAQELFIGSDDPIGIYGVSRIHYMDIYDCYNNGTNYYTYRSSFDMTTQNQGYPVNVQGGGDLNRDGVEDVAWGTCSLGGGSDYGQWVCWYDSSSSSFRAAQNDYTIGSCGYFGVDIYDIDEDSNAEAIFGDNLGYVEIIYNSTSWNIKQIHRYSHSSQVIFDIDCGDQDGDGDPSIFFAFAGIGGNNVSQLEHTGAAGSNNTSDFTDLEIYKSSGGDPVWSVHCTRVSYDGSDGALEVIIGEERSTAGANYELFVIEPMTTIPEFSSFLIPISFSLVFIAIFNKITTGRRNLKLESGGHIKRK